MRLLGLFLLGLWLAGCTLGGVDVQGNPEGGLDITVRLTENEVNALIMGVLANNPSIPLRNVTADLQPGRIVLNGTYNRPTGGTANGRIVLSVSVVDGVIRPVITEVDIEGFSANDATLRQFNDQLGQALGARGTQANRNARITVLAITDTTLTFTLRVSR
ncbi:MAG: hypothetical protein SNJ80_10215 [Anaerolinea sp.]